MTAAAAAAWPLAGCSWVYDVRAAAIGGRLAFVSDDPDFDCVANVSVSAVGEARAVPAAGDDRALVVNGGAHWWTRNPVSTCVTGFPLFYGGAAGNELVAAKRLRTGVVYEVNSEGLGGYGGGCFRITAGLRVENLAEGACFRP